jgi:uncharacterized membrane protein YkgB
MNLLEKLEYFYEQSYNYFDPIIVIITIIVALVIQFILLALNQDLLVSIVSLVTVLFLILRYSSVLGMSMWN